MNAILLLSALVVLSTSAFCLAAASPMSSTIAAPLLAESPRIANSAAGPVVVKVPFVHTEGDRMRLARQGRHAEFQALLASRQSKKQNKHGEQQNATSSSSGLRDEDEPLQRAARSVVVTSPLNDYWDGFWTAVVGVGNPAQYFSVVIDTGSANFWVMDDSCHVAGCVGHALFHSNKSSSYRLNGTPLHLGYSYANGSNVNNGFQGVDEFVLQGGTGSISLAILGMPFGQMNDVPTGTNTAVSGILGLGWQSIAINNMLPPIMYAISVGAFQQGLFTAYLATNYSGWHAGGHVTFGALDTTNCGDVLGYAPLTATGYWQFALDKVSVGSTVYAPNATQAISDTGASGIGGPSAIVAQIATAVGATWNSSWGAYVVGCSKQYPAVTFVINGVSYPLTYKTLTIGYAPTGSGLCLFGIMPNGNTATTGIQWIIGDTFIRQYCTIYDVTNKRIGFAKANAI